MKPLLLIFALSLSLTAGVLAGTPEERKIPIDRVYAPSGFDNNDNVEVVVTGYLPNLCHKAPAAKVKIKGKTIKITVSSLYYSESNPFCPEMVVPFMQTVSLGLLKSGSYNIVVNGGGEFETSSKIEIAGAQSHTVDAHNYAYVEYVEKEIDSDTVSLKGYNVSDCFELDKIEYFHNDKDTYSILPILKQVSQFCPKKMTPFTYEFKVPRELKSQKVLLHVRTLNGNSVNTIFTYPNEQD